MASTELNSDDNKNQELNDLTTCCICTEVYTDPKALPCIHTFCLNCIQATGVKANKGPGDEMPCPICGRLFKIPAEGFHALPKNVFVERLMQGAKVSDSSTASRTVCDACMEDEKDGTGKEIPSAAKDRVECKRKLCEECCSEHRKFKLTKKHELMAMTEYESDQKVMTEIVQSVCELHEQTAMNVYCTDCKTVVCSICFIDDHKNHNGSHVNKLVTGFRAQIESGLEAMNECRSTAEAKKAELMKLKEDIQERVENLESDVEKRKDELKQLIEKHATSLVQDLCSIKQSKMKEIQLETDDIDAYLSNLETYKSYCQNIMTKGSASDICCAFSDLSSRAVELQRQCQLTNDIEIKSFNFSLRKSEVERFLTESCDNLIGEIHEDGKSKSKKTSKEIVLEDLLNLRSANDQLSVDINNEVEANKAHKMTIKTLEDTVEKLEQELLRIKHDQLRYLSDPVLIRTIRIKAAEDETKTVWGLTILDNELFVVSTESSEVEVYDSIEFGFSRRWNLKELIDPADIGSCNRNKCLYIMDRKDHMQTSDIFRVDPNGKLIKKWSAADIWGLMSVTDESNVILTDYVRGILNEYSPEGQLIHEINLSSVAGIRYPLHAIKLTNDRFLVSHGYYDGGGGGLVGENDFQRLCIVDADGQLKKSFGVKRGSGIGRLNNPSSMSVDGNGFIMVADTWNNRVLLLDSNLQFKREILSSYKHGLRKPSRILLDESNGRLFVVVNGWNSKEETFVDGRILIFDFK